MCPVETDQQNTGLFAIITFLPSSPRTTVAIGFCDAIFRTIITVLDFDYRSGSAILMLYD